MESKFKRYSYTGPVYYYGNKISAKSNLYTMAKDWNSARRNFVYKIANGDKAYLYDIVDSLVKEVPQVTFDDKSELEFQNNRPICDICGYEMNDAGECPVCDYGEYDLLDLEG